MAQSQPLAPKGVFDHSQGLIMKHHRGRIEVICGSMFSGKTEELIRRVKRAQIARQRVQVFKPRLDDRYAAEQVASHDGLLYQAIATGDTDELRATLDPDATVIAIDEVQFFDWK